MKTKTPATIADLKFNYTFTGYENCDDLHAKEARFKRQNKSLLKFKIKCQDYKFLVNNSEFYIYASSSLSPIESFMEWVNYQLHFHQGLLPKKLVKFELVEENTFRIHLEEVKTKTVKAVKPAVKK